MAKKKYDGVVEAVHYEADGRVKWVRVYLRRGMVWSDRIILERPAFVERLKAGQSFMTGQRTALMGATFEVANQVSLIQADGDEFITAAKAAAKGRLDQDSLAGVPII